MRINLNEIKTQDAGWEGHDELAHRPTKYRSGGWSLHFDNIVEALVNEINGAGAMIACIAWLTHPDLLRAASRIPASFLVQKEDFLRPDSKQLSLGVVRDLYEKGPRFDSRWDLGIVGDLSTQAGYEDIARVRCVGTTVKEGFSSPRMHHKFAVFGDWSETNTDPDFGRFTPRSVATGSFNWTHNATASLENILIVRQPEIARAYAREWAHVLTLSEPCDWEHEYVAPEWRIGS